MLFQLNWFGCEFGSFRKTKKKKKALKKVKKDKKLKKGRAKAQKKKAKKKSESSFLPCYLDLEWWAGVTFSHPVMPPLQAN